MNSPAFIAGPGGSRRLFALLLMAAAGGGCTLGADENEIRIEHFSVYPGVASFIADDHCAKFGKTAKLVQAGIEDTYFVGIRKKISVYQCVGKALPQSQPKAEK
jgi:hypothetical protein